MIKRLFFTVLLLISICVFPAIAEVKVENLNNGYHRITWDSKEEGPYYVYCQLEDGASANKSEERPPCIAIVTNKTVDTYELIPDKNYHLYVYNDEILIDEGTYHTGKAVDFAPFSVDIKLFNRKQAGPEREALQLFSASEIKDDISFVNYGMRIELIYPMLKDYRTFLLQWVVTSPDGSIYSKINEDYVFKHGISEEHINFFSLSPVFCESLEKNDNVLTGTYTLSLYFDGQFVNETEFVVYK